MLLLVLNTQQKGKSHGKMATEEAEESWPPAIFLSGSFPFC